MVLSVILPVNRDDGFLDQAINSILVQTMKNFELLVIANNCTDELWSYLMNKSQEDNRIIPIRLSLGGLTFALNYGVDIAKGKYIARMDADDISMPSRFKTQVNYLIENPSIDLVGSLAYYIDECGNSLKRECVLPENHNDIIKLLPIKSVIIHPSIMVRRSVFLDSGGYKYGFYGEDYELWLRLHSLGFTLHNIQEKLIKYRSHSKQLSDTKFNKIKSVDVTAVLYRYFLLSKNVKFLFGMIIQNKYIQKLIVATSVLRHKNKY